MHNEFVSSSYLDKYLQRGESKRPLSTYYDGQINNDRPITGKSLRWNIEESKENYKEEYKPQFTSSLSALEPSTTNLYSNKSTAIKRTW